MMNQESFSVFDYLRFKIYDDDRSVVAPAPFGKATLVAFARTICGHGSVTHKFGNSIVPGSFSSSDELINIFGMNIAHSEWFISFEDGTRAFLDFEDDLLILLFDKCRSDILAGSLRIDELYQAASRELDIIRKIARTKEHILRFEAFVERALRA